MLTLDLHGLRHHQVEAEAENFLLLNDFPVKIITGNSLPMRKMVEEICIRHGFQMHFENDWNLGAVIITHT